MSDARVGMGHPAIVIPATADETTVNIVLRDLEAAPTADDLTAGLLVSSIQPGLVTRPTLTLLGAAAPTGAVSTAAPGAGHDYSVRLAVRGLFAFGDSSVPLLYKGRQVESLKFSKPGLVLKSPGDEGYVAREEATSQFPLILVNPSGFAYKNVRARLRFLDTDLCSFVVEEFQRPNPGDKKSDAALKPTADCNSYPTWTSFSVPSYADVTLRAASPPVGWFREPDSGVAREGKRHGVLTLRYGGDGEVVHEQNLPFDVDFKPSGWAQFRSLAQIALWLIAGAVLSLLLRVSLPNIKRKRALKDQLDEIAAITRSISTEVDSTLRVLLRVDRLALEEIRQSVPVFGPGYVDCARRVEQALPNLKRRNEAVRRLDTTLARRRLLMGQGPAPTRLEQIESHLQSVSETLKQDSLTEEDWVLVDQHLEAAQKLLREPTQAEKEAFSALLSGRWKAIREHFKVAADGSLGIPGMLTPMANCFPRPALLPDPADQDGTQWIQRVGTTRADLQLSALSLVWEFEFLLPDPSADPRWADAMKELSLLLATPAIDNLRRAKSLLRRLAENIDALDIEAALQQGMALIEMDPAIPRPNQRIRFSVRFGDDRLNIAAARDLFTCRWTFADGRAPSIRVSGKGTLHRSPPPVRTLSEEGWSVHHYFESDVVESHMSVCFHTAEGGLVSLAGNSDESHWYDRTETVQASRRSRELWARTWLETIQLAAALLVPLATLTSSTLSGGNVGTWWQLIAIGFASDTIKNILVGRQES